MKIVLATHNKDKCKELQNSLSELNVQLLSLFDFPEIGEIVEDGITLKENALIKAREVNKITGLPSLADDTGLEVDFLGGKPGVYTARYAGENCTYMDNVKKLLYDMKESNNRNAEFKTVIAFVDKNVELIAYGSVKGLITKKIKGFGGFGYDPVFYIEEQGKTFAEMKIEEKNTISHRALAIEKMKNLLAKSFNSINIKSGDTA